MATEHGHGYRSTYNGRDQSAAEQFSRLTDLASELETSYGCIHCTVATGAIAVTTVVKIPFDGVYLTSTDGPYVPAGSRDVAASVTNERLAVRYGGMYRAMLQGTIEYVAVVAAPLILQFYVNGVAAGYPVAYPVAAPATVIEHFSVHQFLLVPDRGYVEAFALGAGAGNTAVFHQGMSLSLIGNRL